MARPELSERELQVLQYVALGRSNKEIGQVLYISENTVKGHVKSILTKLDAIGLCSSVNSTWNFPFQNFPSALSILCGPAD